MLGRAILENLGLLDDEILNIYKLEKFLISVSNQYIPETSKISYTSTTTTTKPQRKKHTLTKFKKRPSRSKTDSVWVQIGLREVCGKIAKSVMNLVTMVHFNPYNLRCMYVSMYICIINSVL